MLRRIVPLLLLAACGGNSAATTPSRPVAATPNAPPSADRRSVERIERALADDSMEGRGTGTVGGQRAAKFLASEMAKLGLKPGGDSGYFQRVPYTPRNAAGRKPVSTSNVIGILPGTDPKLRTEYVIVLSHYDHLGIGRPVNGDSIFNGADDDASGTTAVLEVARHLSRTHPQRSIIFANMTGEEVGLVGTRFFLAHPAVPLTQIVAGFEIEMIGRPDSLAGGPGKAWLTGYERTTLGDMLKARGIAIVPDPRPCESFFTRSDNYGFAQHGIVAQTLSTFNLHKDYHHVGDDVSKIDFDHMTRVIASATAAVTDLANGAKPAWHPKMDPTSLPERRPANCNSRQ